MNHEHDLLADRKQGTHLRGYRVAAVAGVLLGGGLLAGVVAAAPMDTIDCPTCVSIGDLQLAAQKRANARGWPQGTHIIVQSLAQPMIGHFPVYINVRGLRITPAILDTKTTGDAVALYRQIYGAMDKWIARAIEMPFQWPALDSSVSLTVERTLVWNQTGDSGVDIYHWITALAGEPSWNHVDYVTYFDTVGKYSFQLFTGDQVTVTFPGGFAAKYSYQGANATPANRWKYVQGSLLLNGKPYDPPTPSGPGYVVSGGNAASGGSNGYYGSANGVAFRLENNQCWGTGTITITAPDGSTYQGSGVYSWQC